MSRPHTHTGTRGPTNGSHQSNRTGRVSPELVRAVRQLVGVAMGYLNNHPQCSCEEALSLLPTTDENFHRYDLVRQLQDVISSQLSPLVTKRLGSVCLEGDGHSSAAQLTEDILSSPQYQQLHHSFTSHLRDTVEEMLDNSVQLSLSPAHSHPPSLLGRSISQSTQYFSLDASLSSDLSYLFSQTALWSPDQLMAIAEDLAPTEPLEVRVEAMQHLLQFPVGDLVGMETWVQLKPVLSDALMDSDTTLAGLSLTLHSRLFSVHTSTTAGEAFLSLIQQLHGFFQGYEGVAITMAMGIDPADDRALALLQKVNLLNHFQREVTTYWLRFNERTVEDMISATFDLLTLGYDRPLQLGPTHFLSLVDPLAQWFQRWTHGQFSRSRVFTAMRERPLFLQGVVSHVMGCRVHRHGYRHSKHTLGFYNKSSLHYIHFCQCVSILGRMLIYSHGRTLFPVTTGGRQVTITDILVHLLKLLYSLPPPPATLTSDPWDHTYQEKSLDPALLIIHIFQELVAASSASRELLTHEAVLTTLIAPIESVQGEGPGVAMETMEWVGQIMGRLSSSESGRRSLLGSPALLARLAGFCRQCLDNQLPVNPSVMATWLFVCRQIYKTGAGLVAMEKYQFHTNIANSIKKIGVEEIKGHLGGRGFHLGCVLVDHLLTMCWSPRGVWLVETSGLLELCVCGVWQRMRQELPVSWCDRHGYECLVSQIASTFSGARELISCGLVSRMLEEVWGVLEGEGEGKNERRDAILVAPQTHPLDTADHTLYKALTALLNVISNFPVMHELLTSDLSTPEAAPSVFTRLLDQLVLVDPAHNQSLLGYPEHDLIALRVISMVTTSLDTLLLFQVKFNLLELLLRQQRAAAMENGAVAVNEVSVLRNRLLVAGHVIGGPSERHLPPLFVTEPDEDYPWPFFTNYPPPSCYYGNITMEIDIDQGSQLYRLLSTDHIPSCGKEVWLSEMREVFCEEVTRRGTLPNDLIAVLLKRVVEVELSWPLADGGASTPLTTSQLSPSAPLAQSSVNNIGAEMIIRYGVSLGLLSPPTISTHLPSLMSLLTHHKLHPDPSPLYPGFDWLKGLVFLMMRGDVDTSQQLLCHLPVSANISNSHRWTNHPSWPSVQPAFFITCHYVEMILQSEAPHLLSAFQQAGCTVSQVVCLWLRQCFLNYLDWSQVLLYLATIIVMGLDYQVYYCVCVLWRMEDSILLHSQRGHLLPHLLEEGGGLKVFHGCQWLQRMTQLQSRYRDTILPSLVQCDT